MAEVAGNSGTPPPGLPLQGGGEIDGGENTDSSKKDLPKLSPRAKELLVPIDTALRSIGLDPGKVSLEYLFNSKEDKLTDYGFLLLSDDHKAREIRGIWKELVECGISNPLAIRFELLYDYNTGTRTAFVDELCLMAKHNKNILPPAIKSLNSTVSDFHMLLKAGSDEEYHKRLNALFDALDKIKETYPQFAVSVSLLQDAIAPNYRYNVGIVDADGVFRQGETMILPDGREGYLEFERGMPVGMIVKGDDTSAGSKEILFYKLGFDKHGNIVPIGYGDRKNIQLVPGGTFVPTAQTKTTARELGEQSKQQEMDFFTKAFTMTLDFVGKAFVRGPAGYGANGLSYFAERFDKNVGLEIRKWGTASINESYSSITNAINLFLATRFANIYNKANAP
ncbi:hypothetical protein ACFL6Y_11075, partial [Elusimicrobiota bacterium]